MRLVSVSLLSLSFCLVSLGVMSFAPVMEAAAADKAGAVKPSASPTPLPQKGTLAGTTSGGYGRTAVPGVWGSDDGNMDGEKSPVSASVSRVGNTDWLVKVFNNSADDYRLTMELVQVGDNGKTVKAEPFGVSLRAKQKMERNFRMHTLASNAFVNVKSWKKTTKAAPAAGGSSAPSGQVSPMATEPIKKFE